MDIVKTYGVHRKYCTLKIGGIETYTPEEMTDEIIDRLIY